MKKLLTLVLIGLFLSSFTVLQSKDWNIPPKYKTMKSTVKSTPESIKLGKALYDKNCKICHGVKGDGKGNITSFTSKEYKDQKDGEKYFKSFVGNKQMPNFEKRITDENDRWNLINYVETFK